VSAFASVVIDVDSTLCGIEGIDFLAARRGREVETRIVALTDKAMRGELTLESIYGRRLTIIQPTRADIDALAQAYEHAIAPGAADAIARMREAGIRLILVSGGIRQAIEPLALALGFADQQLLAVSLTFNADGQYLSFDERSPLTTQRGKVEIVSGLIDAGDLPRPVLAIGDGATDVPLRDIVDTFAAYTGFARRTTVVARAGMEIRTFEQLAKLAMG
jgi:phosphoserine phosphatase